MEVWKRLVVTLARLSFEFEIIYRKVSTKDQLLCWEKEPFLLNLFNSSTTATTITCSSSSSLQDFFPPGLTKVSCCCCYSYKRVAAAMG